MDGKISVFGNETLSDELSLLILLENDMEMQKSDGIHAIS